MFLCGTQSEIKPHVYQLSLWQMVWDEQRSAAELWIGEACEPVQPTLSHYKASQALISANVPQSLTI